MRHRKHPDLPPDQHLREDISLPAPEPDSESEHLARDINLPPEESVPGVEFDEVHYTSGQLNAGTYAAGLSPNGEYAQKRAEKP